MSLKRCSASSGSSPTAVRDRRGQLEVERARIESEAEHLTRTCFSELAMSLEDVVTSVQISGQWSVISGQQAEQSDDSEMDIVGDESDQESEAGSDEC